MRLIDQSILYKYQMLREQKQPESQDQPWSTNGVIKIVQLFTNKDKNKNNPYISKNTEKLYHAINIDLGNGKKTNRNSKQVDEVTNEAWRFISQFYLLQLITYFLAIPQLNSNISDKKVLKVITSAYKIVMILKFYQSNMWKMYNFPQLSSHIKEYKNIQINNLINTRPLIQDLDDLHQLKKIMETPKQTKNKSIISSSIADRYLLICHSIQQKPQPQFNVCSTQAIFDDILNLGYSWVDRRISSFQAKQIVLKLQKIKVIILYMRCITHLKTKKLSRSTDQSKIGVLLKQQSYETLKRYFDVIEKSGIDGEKKYCRELFKWKDTETINEGSWEESSGERRDNLLPGAADDEVVEQNRENDEYNELRRKSYKNEPYKVNINVPK